MASFKIESIHISTIPCLKDMGWRIVRSFGHRIYILKKGNVVLVVRRSR